jgi:hypothetical protein
LHTTHRCVSIAALSLLALLAVAASVHAAAGVAVLTWTAPGDDGMIGTAKRYDIRRSRVPLTMLTFSGADTVGGAPTPAPAGTIQSCPVILPSPGITYFFGIRTVDRAGNLSWISNIVTITAPRLSARARLPEQADFADPWPNPARASTSLELAVPAPSLVAIDVFDATGRHVRSVLAGDLEPGSHHLEWNLRDDRGLVVAGGVYFVRVRIGAYARTRQVIVIH